MKITTRYIAVAGALMLITTGIGGWLIFSYFYERESVAFLDRLERQVAAATVEHGEIFDAARESQLMAASAFRRRLDAWRARDDLGERFRETFDAKADGTFRSRDQVFEGVLSREGQWIYGLGAFIAPGAEADAERQAQLLAAYDVVTRFGEGSLYWADNFYYYTPLDDLIIFAPEREDRLEYYRKLAPADFTIQNAQLGKHVRPEYNADRTMRCTGLVGAVYDQTKKRLSSGCQSPVDLGTEHVGAFGVTFFLDGWLSDVIANPIEGTKPFIIQSDGEMIAHEVLADRTGGEEFAKKFAADMRADALLKAIAATGQSAGTMFFEPWDAYVAYSMFPGPSWYYVARVPKSSVRSAALSEAVKFAGVGVIMGLFLILLSAVVLRKIIAQPLQQLTAQADRDVSDAAHVQFTEAQRNDEIGSLSRSFQRRDERFKQLVSNLDGQIQARTAELIEARDSAEEANSAKSSFLANMSHEIRTPLNGIVGMAQVLAKSDLRDKDRHYIDVIQTASFSLLDVINDVLDLSKIESGSLEFENVAFSLEELVTTTVKPFEHRAEEKGVKLYVSIDDTARRRYCSDPTKIKQVLTNFIANALKFTDAGSVSLSVAAEEASYGKHQLHISVQDTGVGISETGLRKLFQPFMQADSSTTRKYGGTGLGLTICKRIVEGLGGDISVRSEPGRGSCFSFEIPVAVDEQSGAQAPAYDESHARDVMKDLSVLVAEDQEPNRMVVEAILGSSVRRLSFAKDGVEAVAAWRNGDIDFILMDIQMPSMDGVEATRKIREIEAAKGLTPVPIVALTANAFAEQAEHYRASGMDAHLAKPIDFRALYETILACVERKSRAA
ncbi:MAG: ATP-binding protein [Pseudomonadota bacterium]